MKKAKIIIAGAGVGGLQLAYALKGGDFDVVIVDNNHPSALSYNWADDIERKIFAEYALPLPEGGHTDKKDWTFISPITGFALRLPVDPKTADYHINRRMFAEAMIARAENAQFLFGTRVLSLIVEEGKAVGIKTDKGDLLGDLVVDCLGANSVLRTSAPSSFKIQPSFAKGEIFHAYRGFFKRNPVPEVIDTNKAYLRGFGLNGLGWCVDEKEEGQVDILIGDTDPLTKEKIDSILDCIRKDNPCLSTELLKYGEVFDIPVRYPLTRLAANGYVLLGDSGGFTIPVMGSGMATSIRSGDILAKLLKATTPPYTAEKLWKYQVGVFESFGAKHVAVDVIKRFLLKTDINDIDFLFSSGIISDEEMAGASSGKDMGALTFSQIIEKLKVGYKRLPLLISLSGTLKSSAACKAIAEAIPQNYDENAIDKWEKKINKKIGK